MTRLYFNFDYYTVMKQKYLGLKPIVIVYAVSMAGCAYCVLRLY